LGKQDDNTKTRKEEGGTGRGIVKSVRERGRVKGESSQQGKITTTETFRIVETQAWGVRENIRLRSPQAKKREVILYPKDIQNVRKVFWGNVERGRLS